MSTQRRSSEPSAHAHQGATAIVEHDVHDRAGWSIDWLCEKWDQDRIEFVQKILAKQGVTHLPCHVKAIDTPMGKIAVPAIMPIEYGIPSAMLREFFPEPDGVEEIPGNLLVNEGIQRMWDLIIAAGGVAYNNANSFIGVGDSSAAEAATQTDLQAATNHFYKAMNATFPSRASQTVSFQSDFTSTEANYAWQEWSVSAGATTASGAGFTTGTTNMNRKVQSLGTKTTGTWTLTAQITIS